MYEFSAGLMGRWAATRAEKEQWCRKSCTECVHHGEVTPIYMGKDERIVMAENVLKLQAQWWMTQIDWVRRDLILQDLFMQKESDYSASLAFCILLQYWYSIAVSSSFDLYIALESLSHLIVWPTKHLPSFFLFFFFFPQYDSSVLFFSSHPFGFSSSPWDLGKDFSQLKKKIHTISQSLYQTYALMRQKESQWWFLSHSKKYNTFMHCIVGVYRKFAICYGKTESVDEDGKWDPWNLYSTYHI